MAVRDGLERLSRLGVAFGAGALRDFASRFERPEEILAGAAAFLEAVEQDGTLDRLTPEQFARFRLLRGNLSLLTCLGEGPLLTFPEAARVYDVAARTIPDVLAAQVAAYFPGLAGCLTACRPGATPADVDKIWFEDVKTGMLRATTGVYHLRGRDAAGPFRLVLKRTDAALERIIAGMLEDVFGLQSVRVLWCGPVYSALALLEGASLREISGNPLSEPRRRCWDSRTLGGLARELGREAAVGWKCRLWSRHGGNIIATCPERLEHSEFVRIDFGQSLLPVRNPYTEAVMPLWHLRRFFPGEGNLAYETPEVYLPIWEGWAEVSRRAAAGIGQIARHLEAAVGLAVPEMEGELVPATVTRDHVEGLLRRLRQAPPAEVEFDQFYNSFYQGFWQVLGWSEYRPPAQLGRDWAGGDLDGLLQPRSWICV